jgi:hypothetical protein
MNEVQTKRMAPKESKKFPPVCIVNFDGPPNYKIIRQTVNTAFGGEAVMDKGGIRKSKNGLKVNFKQEYDRTWLFDDFYSDLTEYGSVWIDSTYLGDEVYTQAYIAYSTVPIDGHWELRLA